MMSRKVQYFPYVTEVSGRHLLNNHSMYFVLVFPNCQSFPPLSTRGQQCPGKEFPDAQ